MSRKAFLVWGLLIIHLAVVVVAIMQYLAFSKTTAPNQLGVNAYRLISDMAVASFAITLLLRLKGMSWREKAGTFCIVAPLYIVFTIIGALLSIGYIMSDVFGTHDRFFSAIYSWADLEAPKPASPWTVMQRVEYVLFQAPAFYLMNSGLFALLWFGNLDPRKPSKNRFVQFMKTGFQFKDGPKPAKFTKLARA